VRDVGVHNVAVTVSMTRYPGVASITKNLVLKIECKVLKINSDPDLITKRYYRILIDSPLILPLKFTETPECGLSYNIYPSTVPFKVVFSNSPN
jgi:hypothetical protein